MRKTSVYLTDDEAEGLRRLAVREGRPQAELIREGVRKVIAEIESQPRAAPGGPSRRSSSPAPDPDEETDREGHQHQHDRDPRRDPEHALLRGAGQRGI